MSKYGGLEVGIRQFSNLDGLVYEFVQVGADYLWKPLNPLVVYREAFRKYAERVAKLDEGANE